MTHATNDRTLIAGVIPRAAVNDKFLLMFPSRSPGLMACLLANLNSFVLDHCARQKIGGLSLKYFIMRQLPVLPPLIYESQCPWDVQAGTIGDWLLTRVLELVYTAWDMEPFARDCGRPGPPFRWDDDRRLLLRCELDAAFFHLYLPTEADGRWRLTEGETADELARLTASFPSPREAVDYIMETFALVRRKDEEKYGDYRTKLRILAIYDRMQQAIATSTPYQTELEPPPADSRVAYSASTRLMAVGTST